MKTTLLDLFDSVPAAEGHSFHAVETRNGSGVLLGRSAANVPYVLLPEASRPLGERGLVRRLRNIQVSHGNACEVLVGVSAVEGFYTIVERLSDDPLLAEHFLRLVEALLDSVAAGLDVEEALDQMIKLFESLDHVSSREAQGLWGELLVIARASEPVRAFESWHDQASERYDFSHGSDRVDCKVVSGRIRKHHFSLEQLNPAGAEAVIVSMLTEPSSGGVSVVDLVDEVKALIPRRHHLTLEAQVAEALGRDWVEAESCRFDRQLAEGSLRFYEASSLPSVDPALPQFVSGVQFVADLTTVTPMSLADVRSSGRLWAALAPLEDS